MKQRIYLDTSVVSALDDARRPERAEMTREFWELRDQYVLSTSQITREEVGRTGDPDRRRQMLLLLEEVAVHPVTEEMEALARVYVDSGVFPERVFEDALHVAAAVMTRNEVLLSWNFKHLVNRRRRAAVNAVNLARGLPPLEIISPPEL